MSNLYAVMNYYLTPDKEGKFIKLAEIYHIVDDDSCYDTYELDNAFSKEDLKEFDPTIDVESVEEYLDILYDRFIDCEIAITNKLLCSSDYPFVNNIDFVGV